MRVRLAKPEELRIIQNLNHDLFVSDSDNDPYLIQHWPYKEGEDYFRKRISGKDGVCYVAEENGEIVGYLAGGLTDFEPWRIVRRSELENMYVKKEYRGRGAGRMLVEKFADWSRQKKADYLFLSVYSGNRSAQEFYKKVGFETTNLFMEKKILK